ncbi:hypothetical protein [Paenibacillus ferrarius]|uniref:hypothetical protein n=1 Tax=Paenibacillus ferrarius TaxID=1469647 RepID=UPI003D27F7EA
MLSTHSVNESEPMFDDVIFLQNGQITIFDSTKNLRGRPFQQGMTMNFSILMLSIYFIIFILTAWFVFTKRDVAA